MTIKRTDEMERVMYAALAEQEPGRHHAALRKGLDAVLAIVERDRAALVEWHWAQLEPCPSPDPKGTWNCEREAGHEGVHQALRWFREWTDES